jgi:hypothetical protein
MRALTATPYQAPACDLQCRDEHSAYVSLVSIDVVPRHRLTFRNYGSWLASTFTFSKTSLSKVGIRLAGAVISLVDLSIMHPASIPQHHLEQRTSSFTPLPERIYMAFVPSPSFIRMSGHSRIRKSYRAHICPSEALPFLLRHDFTRRGGMRFAEVCHSATPSPPLLLTATYLHYKFTRFSKSPRYPAA